MKNLLKAVATATGLTLALSGAANAQDWSGRYVGLSAGAADSTVEWTDTLGGWYTFAPGNMYEDQQDSSTVIGVHYGALYNLENNRVWGWELGYAAIDHDTTIPSPLFGSDVWNTRLDGMISVTGRYGFATGRWLPYLEGGVALGNFGVKNTDAGFCTPPCVLDIDGWQPGLILGLGVDYWISDQVTLGLNYRHTAFETQTYTQVPTNRPAGAFETYEVGGDAGIVTVRLNWMFN